jgi:hypothetical protein
MTLVIVLLDRREIPEDSTFKPFFLGSSFKNSKSSQRNAAKGLLGCLLELLG